MGRPSKYRDEFADQAAKLCRLGATDNELADFFHVTVRTVALWKVQFPAFFQSLKVGKAAADKRVEASLYQRALGYETDELDIRIVGAKLVKTQIRKHYPPDTTACIFWLKNRKSKEWRDRQEITGDGGGPLTVVINKLG